MSVRELAKEGHSIRAISRITGHSRNTVRKILSGEHSLKMKTYPRPSKIEPYKEYLKARFEEHGLSAVRLIEEIKPMGYDGSIATVRRYLATLRGEATRRRKVTVRFESAPGKQAQADWAYCGRFPTSEDKRLSVYAFVMVLGFSRQLFVHFTTSMRMPELIRCHQLAFDYFGGWPEHILYDNMKQVRASRSRFNEGFMDFAQHYGFVPKTHRAYRPRTKGKVERAVDYVKQSFLAGRTFEGLDDLNAQAMHWLEHTANVRTHATTKARPCDLFEKETLTPVDSVSRYNYIDPVKRTVSWESMVRFDGSRYSVPPAYAGKVVEVAAQGGIITVRLGDMVIAEHKQAAQPDQSIVNKDHLAELWKLTEEQTRLPKRSSWHVKFQQSVQQASLAQFEEVVQ